MLQILIDTSKDALEEYKGACSVADYLRDVATLIETGGELPSEMVPVHGRQRWVKHVWVTVFASFKRGHGRE